MANKHHAIMQDNAPQQAQTSVPHIVAIVVTPQGYKQGTDALGRVGSRFSSDHPYPCKCDKHIHDG